MLEIVSALRYCLLRATSLKHGCHSFSHLSITVTASAIDASRTHARLRSSFSLHFLSLTSEIFARNSATVVDLALPARHPLVNYFALAEWASRARSFSLGSQKVKTHFDGVLSHDFELFGARLFVTAVRRSQPNCSALNFSHTLRAHSHFSHG